MKIFPSLKQMAEYPDKYARNYFTYIGKLISFFSKIFKVIARFCQIDINKNSLDVERITVIT